MALQNFVFFKMCKDDLCLRLFLINSGCTNFTEGRLTLNFLYPFLADVSQKKLTININRISVEPGDFSYSLNGLTFPTFWIMLFCFYQDVQIPHFFI